MIGSRRWLAAGLCMFAVALISIAEAAEEITAKATSQANKSGDGLPEPAAKWYRLARYYEADRQFDEAAKAIAKALALAPNSVPCVLAAAKIHEAQNNLLAAVETNTKLATIDRRYRTEHLKKVAQIESRLGRREKALQAGRDVLASAPGNPDAYEFFAQLCFQLGAAEEGLETLRRQVRSNPSDPRSLLTLANALAEQFRTDEAIELLWRAFEKGDDLDAKLSVVQKLAELYLQTNQFDKLTDRLERLRREAKEPREMTICMAQAYQQAGDDGTARLELEKLLTADTRDTMLLQQLVKLCESSGDIDEALKYQQQLSKVAPGRDQELRLSQLLTRFGDNEQASAILTRLTADEKDPEQLLKAIDSLLNHGKREEVVAITSRLLRDQPKNWELLYREGIALAEAKPAEATQRFETLLKLSLSDDEPDTATRERKKREASGKNKPVTTRANSPRSNVLNQLPPSYLRMQTAYQIRNAVGLDSERYYVAQQGVWMPTDFGQCRMASEAWLMSFAEKSGRGEEFLAARRQQWESKKEDLRAAWDWYYLQVVRQDGPALHEATKALSLARGAGNDVKMLYLQSLANRTNKQANRYVDPEEAAKAEVPPLPEHELQHMLACHDALKSNTDLSSLYYGRSMLQTVMTELRRAKREDEAKARYAEMLAAATTPEAAYAATNVATMEGDSDAMLKLVSVLVPDEAAPNSTANANSILSYIQGRDYQASMLSTLMGINAEKKKLDEQPKAFEKFLTRTIRERQRVISNRQRMQAQSAQTSRAYYVIYQGISRRNLRSEQLDFPTPNEFYDQPLLQVLRQMWSNHKDADKLQELREHFVQCIQDEARSKDERLFWHLGLAYLEWWSNRKAESLAAMNQAAELLPDNTDVKLQLAATLERESNTDAALQIINSITSLDQQTLQAVETMALRLSVNAGDLDRARKAAERLFGLRLEANLQVQLAQQMFQLGMIEMAEAVMSRASRQAGNKTQVLVSLMQQYSSQNKTDVAAQIAYQLLRRTPPSQQSRMSGGRTYDDQARQQALVVLNRTGRMSEMIAKLEAQLEKSPDSTRLLEMLSEYYTASGQQAKSQEVLKRMAKKSSNDPLVEFDLALKLAATGDTQTAIEKMKVVLTKQPQAVANRWHEIEQAFRRANKMDELYAAVETMDLKAFRQNPYQIGNILQYMLQDAKYKDRAVKLFKRAWEAMPDRGDQILSYVSHREEIWQLPEMYDYLRQALIPAATLPLSDPWKSMQGSMSYHQDGRVESLVTRSLKMATQQKKLGQLGAEIDAALAKHSGWHGGRTLKALIHAKSGQSAEAKLIIEKLLDEQLKRIPTVVLWILGQEIDAIPELRDTAIRCLQSAAEQPDPNRGDLEFEYSPARRLISLYAATGEKAKARGLLLKAWEQPSSQNYDPQYAAYRKVNSARAIAQEMLKLDFALDAIRLYREIGQNADLLEASKRYGGDYLSQEFKRGMSTALRSLKPEMLPDLLKPSGDKLNGTNSEQLKSAAIALALIVEPAELDKARLQSLIGNMLMKAKQDKVNVFEQFQSTLADLRKSQPDDLTLMILEVLSRLETPAPQDSAPRRNANVITTASNKVAKSASISAQVIGEIESLAERVSALPVPTTPQRDAAKSQIALWLIARECLTEPRCSVAAKVLADRALASARAQPANEQAETLAILREWGELALAAGDANTAETMWSEMLTIVLPRPAAKQDGAKGNQEEGSKKSQADDAKPNAKPNGEQKTDEKKSTASASGSVLSNAVGSLLGFAQASGTAKAARPATAVPGSRGNVSPIPTPSQFEQAAQIARLAAQNRMLALSTRAMRETLKHGPPMERLNAEQFGRAPTRSISINGSPEEDVRLQQVFRQVEERLTELEQLWRKHGIKEAELFDTLMTIVFPEFRPNELFLYAQPLANTGNQSPRSVGLMLTRSAAGAGIEKADALRERIAAKVSLPTMELTARVLAAQLAAFERNSQAAQEQLAKLQELLKKSPLQTSIELAAHAALPATQLEKLPAAAVPLLEQVVLQVLSNVQNANEEPARTLTFKLAAFYLQADRPGDAKRRLDDFVVFLGPVYARYGGDYGPFRRREVMLQIAGLYAAHRRFREAFDFLGQYADIPVSRDYGSGSSSSSTAKLIYTALAGLSPSERYELLKQWSLPVQGRQSVRSISSVVPEHCRLAPRDELNASSTSTAETTSATATTLSAHHAERDGYFDPALTANYVPVSSTTMLVDAARETDKLDELRDLVQPAAEKNVENAKTLRHLIQIARGEGTKWEPELKKHLDEQKAILNKPLDASKRPGSEELLIASAALRDRDLREVGVALGQNFFAQASRAGDQPRVGLVRRELAIGRLVQIPNSTYLPNADPGLKHWVSGSLIEAARLASGTSTPWWIAHDGMLFHNSGADQDELFFAYPLTGTFEFSCDLLMNHWCEAGFGFGGLIVETLSGGLPTSIHSASRSESITTHSPLDKLGEYNRFVIRVNGHTARYIFNGHLLYTDSDCSLSSPFLALTEWQAWQTAFRNICITGEPIIPREVSLIHEDRMDGWVTSFFSETQPPRISIGQPDRYGRQREVTRDTNPDAYDWAAEAGLLLGRRLPISAQGGQSTVPSRLYYHRPLRNGETVRYEFFYDETLSQQVHPTLGRLAMLLEPDGVRLYRMGQRPTTESFGRTQPQAIVIREDENPLTFLEDAFFLDATAFRRGPKSLPLKLRDWNELSLTLMDGICKLSLNGVLVFERPFTATHDLHFGFYHDKAQTSAKIRNVVLSGDWPTSLTSELRGELLASRVAADAPATRQVKAAVIGELVYQRSVRDVVRQARAMPASERFEFLANWVIPNDDHLSWRLYGEFTPTHLSPAVDQQVSKRSGRRAVVGGDFESPITELFAAARELNKLDELGERILNAPLANVGDVHASHDSKARMAMAVLMALATESIGDAQKALLEVNKLSLASSPDLPEIQRWPEFVAVVASLDQPSLWPLAELIAKRMVDQNSTANQGIWWDTRIRNLLDRVRERRGSISHSIAAKPGFKPVATARPKQWHQYGAFTAKDRASGLMSRWEIVGGELVHRSGDGFDLLSFQSPLRGTFEVSCDLPMHGWREKDLIYGTKFARPAQDGKKFVIGSFLSESSGGIVDNPPIVEVYEFRLAVEPGKATSYVNGRKLYEQPLDADCDPWLVLRSIGHYSGFVRNLRITGTPAIPAEIDLTAGTDLSSWLNAYYQNSADNERQPDGSTKQKTLWEKTGDEIVGARLSDSFAGSQTETVLHYHRPLVEDGEIEYEFFYVPGQTLVHPALDRLAFLLQPDGVALHWMTDGAWEASGLSPGNVTVEKENLRGPAILPFKENNWNRLKLSLKGDIAALSLNGKAIYERKLEPTNQRNFGLFRFADETDARVRQIIYRGDWPKTLPKIEEQELTDPPSRFEFTDDELPQKLTWNFRGERPKWAKLTFDHNKFGKFMKQTEEGLVLSLPAGRETPSEQLGFESLPILRGDFEAIVSYKILQVERVDLPEGWKVPGVDLTVRLDSGMDERVYLERRLYLDRDGGHSVKAVRAVSVIPGQSTYTARTLPWKDTSGKLKIMRRGPVVSYLATPEGSKEWKLIDRVISSTSDATAVAINIRSFHVNSPVEVLLTDWSIRTTDLLDELRLQQEKAARAAFPSGQLPVTRIWNFQGSPPEFLKPTGLPLTHKAFEASAKGYQISMLPGRDFKNETLGFECTQHFRGDFEVTATFGELKVNRSAQAKTYLVPGVDLIMALDQPGRESLRLERRHFEDAEKGQAVKAADSRMNAEGKTEWSTINFPWNTAAGRMRIARKGKTAFFLIAAGTSDDWRLLREREIATSDVVLTDFVVRNFDPDSSVEVTLKELTIRAEQEVQP